MKITKLGILVILGIIILLPGIGYAAQKKTAVKKTKKPAVANTVTTSTATTAYTNSTAASIPKTLPMVLDFGRGICIPCKEMKPIL
ncbi:MAG: hypothetical protein ACE14V_16090, partial [bacterium]